MLVKPLSAHLAKWCYPDKEKDEWQLQTLRPYRYFAAIINAYPELKSVKLITRLVIEALRRMQAHPADWLVDVDAMFGGVEKSFQWRPVVPFTEVFNICRHLYGKRASLIPVLKWISRLQ